MAECLHLALNIIAVWILGVLVPELATDGETELVGQHTPTREKYWLEIRRTKGKKCKMFSKMG